MRVESRYKRKTLSKFKEKKHREEIVEKVGYPAPTTRHDSYNGTCYYTEGHGKWKALHKKHWNKKVRHSSMNFLGNGSFYKKVAKTEMS